MNKNLNFRIFGISMAVAIGFTLPCVETAFAQEKPQIWAGIGSASTEYWSDYVGGAKRVAETAGTTLSIMASEYNGQKHLEQFGALFARGCENCAVIIDPASNAFTKAIVDRADDAGAFIVTTWNRPAEIVPWNTAPEHWIAHQSYDSIRGGEKTAEALFKKMNGKGNIVVLEGIPDNPPSRDRMAALQNVLKKYPDIKVLDQQVGNWSRTEAQNIMRTWLARYSDQINGVYSASDGMALGALSSLNERNLGGKIPIVGFDGSMDVFSLIKTGEILATVYVDGAYQGAQMATLAFAVASGDVDLASLPHEKRDYFLDSTLVTAENVDAVIASRDRKPDELSYQTMLKTLWDHASPNPSSTDIK